MERLSGMVTLRVGGASVVVLDGLAWGVSDGAEPSHLAVLPTPEGIQLQDAVTGNLLALPSLQPLTQVQADSNDPYTPHSHWVTTPILHDDLVPFGQAGKGEIFTLQPTEINQYLGLDLDGDESRPKKLVLLRPGVLAPMFLVEPLP